jgi:hypothetical protein
MRRGEMKNGVNEQGFKCHIMLKIDMPAYLVALKKVVCKIKSSE